MELKAEFIAEIESRTGWDADTKQDMYVRMLEIDEDAIPPTADLEDKEYLKNFVNSIYYYMKANQDKVARNRERLVLENEAEIRSTFGYNNTGDDPADIVQGKEEIFTRVKTLSDTLKRTLNEVILTGSSYAEAAEKEGVPEGAIRKRVSDIMRVVKGE
jgi:DNA-directed RNA polymerase specialized sigma24 family protein